MIASNKFMIQRSRELRQRMTLPEKILWQFLRGSCFAGLRFRRQHPIGSYITDFCCLRRKLVIELDGGCHDISKKADTKRDNFLKKRGFRILHFTNDHVFDRIEWLLQTVADELTIDWGRNYHDCVAKVKYPKKLRKLLKKIKPYRDKLARIADPLTSAFPHENDPIISLSSFPVYHDR